MQGNEKAFIKYFIKFAQDQIALHINFIKRSV